MFWKSNYHSVEKENRGNIQKIIEMLNNNIMDEHTFKIPSTKNTFCIYTQKKDR